MKWVIAVALASFGSTVLAVECGPKLSGERIEQLLKPIGEATALLAQHQNSLNDDVRTYLSRAPIDPALNRIDKLQLEITQIGHVMEYALRVENGLNEALTIAAIRDVMLDSRDRWRVNLFLSLKVFGARTHAEKIAPAIGAVLTRLTMPGVAVDISKLRDSIVLVARAFEGCDKPRSAR